MWRVGAFTCTFRARRPFSREFLKHGLFPLQNCHVLSGTFRTCPAKGTGTALAVRLFWEVRTYAKTTHIVGALHRRKRPNSH